MGTLEIRRASANLNNLGQFRMPELGSGSAAAFEAQARAAQSAANSAALAGRATVDAISRRGQIVADTLGGLGRLALEFAERENNRIVDQALTDYESWRNLEMNGDGTETNRGRFNEKIDDVGGWLKDVKKSFSTRAEDIRSDMSAWQRKLFDERVRRDDARWALRINAHAAKTTMANEVSTANEAVAVRLGNAADAFGGAEGDAATDDYFDAVEKALDAQFVPEAQRGGERRQAAVNLISQAQKRRIEAWRAEIGQGPFATDPETVGKAYDEAIRKAEAGGGKFENARLTAALGSEGLTEAEKTLFMNRLQDAKRRAVADSYALRRENWNAAYEEAIRQEAELRKNAPPETPLERKAYFEQMSSDYGKLADNAALDPRVALGYREMSVRLLELSRAENVAASRQVRETQNAAFQFAKDSYLLGKWNAEAQKFEPYSAREMGEQASALFRSNRIDFNQYRQLMDVREKRLDKEGEAFMSAVANTIEDIIPKMLVYNADFNRIEASAATVKGKRVMPNKKSSVETADGERWLYSQLAEAADLTLKWKTDNNKSVPEAVDHFARLTEGAVNGYRRTSVEEALKVERGFIEGTTPTLAPGAQPFESTYSKYFSE